jgi:tetratricopeptide (TPR) repeat protein
MKVKYLSLCAVVALSLVGTISTTKLEASAKNSVDNNVSNNFSFKTLEITPNQPSLLAKSNTDKLLERCVKRYQSQEYERALKSCTKAIEADEDNDNAYLIRGVSKFILGDKTGLQDINRALAINPDSELGYYTRAMVRAITGDAKGATEDSNRFLILNNYSVDGYSVRAMVMLLIDDYEQAIENASQAIRVNHENANGYTMRSFAYFLSGNNKQASEDIEKIIKIGSEPGAYVLRSIIRVQRGDNKGAMEDLNQAISQKSDDASSAYAQRANVRVQMGDMKGAIEDLNRAIKKDKDVGYYRNNLGLIYGRAGDMKKAFENYEKALNNYQKSNIFKGFQSPLSKIFEKSAIKISPFFWEVKNSQDALGYLNRGMSRALLLGNKQEGIADLQVAVNLFREQGKQDEAKKVNEMIKKINS